MAGIPIVEHILKKLEKLDTINEIIIVTNNKFYGHFMVWLNDDSCSKNVKVINDGTISNDDRLGAVGDINYILKNQEINDDLLVIAGDIFSDLKSTIFLTISSKKIVPLLLYMI